MAGTETLPRRAFWRRHPWLTGLGVAAVLVLAALGVAVSVALHRAAPYLRARIVEGLEARFHARVELDSFQVSLINGLWAEGNGLRIWPPGQGTSANAAAHGGTAAGTMAPAGTPMIQLAEFRFHAPLHYTPGKPFHISVVELKGLDVDLPPRSQLGHALGGSLGPAFSGVNGSANPGAGPAWLDVGTIECTNTHLTLETDKLGKLPLQFAIVRLKLTELGTGGAMGFNAELTNPKPVGTIYTEGTFGPWVVEDPGESALEGTYQFEHADLASFRGIAGTLSSTGRYAGTLRDLTVDGETETPDFALSVGDNPMNLRTHFHARVDGTDGDTWLDPVDATLGRSHFTAQGKIVRVAAERAENGEPAHAAGHDIALTVNVEDGRMEDFLRLANHAATPLLTGTLAMKTTLEIPPGAAPVRDRLRLDGSFTLADARFASAKIQDRIEELSLRGQGRTKHKDDADAKAVRSTMQSDFQMAGGVVTLPDLKYTVPGAEIDLKGRYGVAGGELDFTGMAKLQATVSQMVGGWKGLLLRPADRFFEKDGAGTAVPIVIEGTREDPQFGIDFGGLKKTSPQRPGGP